jgi:Methyltransferase FkbM domain
MKSSFFEKLTSKKARLRRLKKKVIDYYSSLPKEEMRADQKSVFDFLKENDISVFPYPFPAEYKASDIELFKDKNLDLYYIVWDGKKLYYKNGNRPDKAQEYFNSLRLEQDIRSPHRYLTKDFEVAKGDIVVDVGAAEGNFSLSVVEHAGYVYLFETDKKWIKALEATFAPWGDKVKIVQKFVGEKTSEESIALDDFFGEEQSIQFIKADVEGGEAQVIRGASRIIDKQKKLKIAVCTYHRQDDAMMLDDLLKKSGFKNSFSDGYMLYYYGRTNIVKEPYLRRAVLRAVKA